jgi:hypothetical protein
MRGTWDGRGDEQRRAYGESKNIPKNWAGAKSQYAKATQAPKGGANANTKTWSGTGQDSDDDSFFSKAAVRDGRGTPATSCVPCFLYSFAPWFSHQFLHLHSHLHSHFQSYNFHLPSLTSCYSISALQQQQKSKASANPKVPYPDRHNTWGRTRSAPQEESNDEGNRSGILILI